MTKLSSIYKHELSEGAKPIVRATVSRRIAEIRENSFAGNTDLWLRFDFKMDSLSLAFNSLVGLPVLAFFVSLKNNPKLTADRAMNNFSQFIYIHFFAQFILFLRCRFFYIRFLP